MAEQPKLKMKPLRQALVDNAPWKPPAWEPEDAGALYALAQGRAEPHQQQRAWRFIIEKLCGTYDLPYRPGGAEGARDTDFAAGKMFVGQQLVKLSKIHVQAITTGKRGEQG